MASDMMEPGEVVRGNTISLSVSGGSKAEIEPIFAKLTEGGNINHPLKEEFFGTYGDLIDRFSIAWMFQAEGNAQ
jgi:PhnB protein